jgi:hypothetical protein
MRRDGMFVEISLNFRCTQKGFIRYQFGNIMMSSTRFQSKTDLLIKIKQVSSLLNGRYRDGSKMEFGSDFKFMRYACVLLAAVTVSNFEFHTKKIRDEIYSSYYSLYKVAKHLGIEFERTKAAPYVYKELIERGYAKTAIENRRTYITFTENGRISCEEKLEELQLLKEHFNENPLELQRYKEKDRTKSMVKGSLPRQVRIKTKTDNLIKSISQW